MGGVRDTTQETMGVKDTTQEIMGVKDTTQETMEVKDTTQEIMEDKDTTQGATTLVAEMGTRSTSQAHSMASVGGATSELRLCLQMTRMLLKRAQSPPSKL